MCNFANSMKYNFHIKMTTKKKKKIYQIKNDIPKNFNSKIKSQKKI